MLLTQAPMCPTRSIRSKTRAALVLLRLVPAQPHAEGSVHSRSDILKSYHLHHIKIGEEVEDSSE